MYNFLVNLRVSLARMCVSLSLRKEKSYEVSLKSSNSFKINFALTHIKKLLKLCECVDIYAVHFPNHRKSNEQFQLNYVLISLSLNLRVRIRIFLGERQYIPSITSVFKSANWLEREVYDMYGIFFANHPDLRRILTDYGFIGFPLRKDFPVSGYQECLYNFEHKRIIYRPVKFAQHARFQTKLNPWVARPE